MSKYTILVVDDEKDNLQLFIRTLRKNYTVLSADKGSEALEILRNEAVDMIISDHKMPEMDGTDFLRHSIDLSPDSIRILVTAFADSEILVQAINEGKIHRYLRKPWTPPELLNIVEACLEIYQLNIDNHKLAGDLKELFLGTISAIMEALDAKDTHTSGRSKRVTYYSLKIGQAYGLPSEKMSELELAGLLHDIGMIGVPVNILTKPDRLTDEEYDLVKNHLNFGIKILQEIKQLNNIIRIVEYHHEHYDGNGYPYGLKGDEIPVESKIIAIADTYDGLTSDRAYRKGRSHDEAVRIIREATGTQFDPEVVEAFERAIVSASEEVKAFEQKKLKDLDFLTNFN